MHLKAFILIFAFAIAGCAGTDVVKYDNCEFVLVTHKYPWSPSQCLTKCGEGKVNDYFPGCSSDSGLLSGIKSATGLVPTIPVTGAGF